MLGFAVSPAGSDGGRSRRAVVALTAAWLLSLGALLWLPSALILALFGTLLAGWELLQPFSLPLFLALWESRDRWRPFSSAGAGEVPQRLGQSLAFWATFSPG